MRRIGFPRLTLGAGLRAAAFATMLVPALSTSGRADEQWRYCVAQDEDGHRFFITEAFPTATAIEDLERSFNAWLDKTGGPHRWGICPRSASAFEAAADVESAVRYNRRLGLEEQPVSWPETRS